MGAQQQSQSAFYGACILSALGSLPLHIMPILIAAAIYGGKVTSVQAGFMPANFAFGQLAITTLLPVLAVTRITGRVSIVVSVIFTVALLQSIFLSGQLFHLNWFIVGLCAGVFSYLGCVAAAANHNRSQAFSMRLAITMLVAGLTMMVLFLLTRSIGYQHIVFALVVVVAVLCIVAGFLYRGKVAELPQQTTQSPIQKKRIDANTQFGLVCIFLFSFAQVGFIVFVVDLAVQRGIAASDAIWAFGICKVVAALILFAASRFGSGYKNLLRNSLFPIPVVLLGCLVVSDSHSWGYFLVGILLWEVGANLLSSSFQASVAEVNPAAGGMFLTCVLLLGSATGPMVNGIAISAGLEAYFFYLVLASVFLPLLFEYQNTCRLAKQVRSVQVESGK